MTNYRRFNAEQAGNTQLLAAIRADLKLSRSVLTNTIEKLREAERMLRLSPDIPELNTETSSGIPRAKYDIHTAIQSLSARIAVLDGQLDDQVIVIAGFMTEAQAAAKLKEHN